MKQKLYFYENTGLFKCYTGCDSTFDIFELCSKVMKIQYDEEFDLNDSVLWVARRFGLSGMIKDDDMGKTLDDWKILSNYSRIQEIELKNNKIILKDYDDSILNRLNYNIFEKTHLYQKLKLVYCYQHHINLQRNLICIHRYYLSL